MSSSMQLRNKLLNINQAGRVGWSLPDPLTIPFKPGATANYIADQVTIGGVTSFWLRLQPDLSLPEKQHSPQFYQRTAEPDDYGRYAIVDIKLLEQTPDIGVYRRFGNGQYGCHISIRFAARNPV